MTAGPLPSTILIERLARQKARLQSLRDQALERYRSGAPGLQVAALISEMTDRLLIEIFEETLQHFDEPTRQSIRQQTAIIAIGGSGRGELAPFSDADILFLHRGVTTRQFDDCVAQAVRDCWDAGIKLGHSVRTLSDTLAMARREPQFATALVEARLVWGSERLYERLKKKFYRKLVRLRRRAFFNSCLAAREVERDQFGATVQQLEPDIKRSAGGLRDIHLIRWIGFGCFGTTELDLLRLAGALSRDDAQMLAAAQEFLMRIRVEMHFAAGRAQEVLSREEQLRLADLYGYSGTGGQRGVERFMQAYFRHSTAVADICTRFVARHQIRSLVDHTVRFLFAHRSSRMFLVRLDEIDVISRYRATVCGDLEQLLDLYNLSGMYSLDLAPSLVEAIKLAVPALKPEISPRSAELFLAILKRVGRVGRVLRCMYATGVLELVIPDMSRVRCLLQFNQYHSFTVDEHSLRAVEAAESFGRGNGPVAATYQEISQQEILHLAMLLHDLGKGLEEDHSQVGLRIADSVADRLRLTHTQRELLVFLVHKHLVMAHLAFRRDLSDPDVLLRFSRDVGSPEQLRMLYVLTAADITAVGPGAWTDWKAELLTELYDRALLILSGRHQPFGERERMKRLREQVLEYLQNTPLATDAGFSAERIEEELAAFPVHYLTGTDPERIVEDLQSIRLLDQQPVIVNSRFVPDTNTVEYRVITRDQPGSGWFSKITGALTAKRLEILTAQICTRSDGIIADAFHVQDDDHVGPIPEFRIREIQTAIQDVLSGRLTVESLFQRHRRFVPAGERRRLSIEPTRVVLDSGSSERFTIVDIFAHDRPGLLYQIASTLLELNLSVSLAKIDTHVDQVLDVFYVTDRNGGKLQDEARLRHVQSVLTERIEEFDRTGTVGVQG